MSFLQPIWLYAISGIIIPIAIHFWNIKEGKAFPVGSIALLERSTKKYTRTVRIAEWLLLALRCLLIIFIAMLLAKPVQQQKFTDKQGWILIDKQHTNIVYDHFKTTIDSLLNKGFELHRFDEGFEQVSLQDILVSEDTTTKNVSYWPLLKKADAKLPASFPVYLFTSNRLSNFKGERPQVAIAVKWYSYAADTSIKQIVKAWRIDENAVRVMLVTNASSGNMFGYEDILVNQQQDGYKINSNKGQLSIAYNNQAPVVVDTSIMRISIYAGKNKQDADYIKAALEAIQTFTKQNIQTTVVNNPSSISSNNNWLFWLSDEAIPKNISAGNVFKYLNGKEVNATSFIQTNQTTQPINLTKRIIADTVLKQSSQIIWQDGFGNSLLVKENIDSNIVYQFYLHVNPQWNDLAWSDAFPSILLHLLFKDEIAKLNTGYTDERTVDVKQIQPAVVDNSNKATASTTEDLSTIFWLIIFLIFCAERIVSFKTRTTTAA